MTKLVVALIFSFCITQNEGAKILALFPVPSISHQVIFRPLTQELAKRGHEVVVITPDPAYKKGHTPPNLTEIDVHNISYSKWVELYSVISNEDNDLIDQMRPTFETVNALVEIQLKTPQVQRMIKEETFDLILLEACARSALVLSHVFKVPVIQVASFGFLNFNVATIGASWHPLLYPNMLTERIHNLTKWEKVVALWNYYRLYSVMKSVEDSENAMAKRLFGPNIPTINKLTDNVDMMFLNVHPLWDSNRPVPPSVVYIWGIHERAVKEMPKELSNYLNSSKNGVVYMSLGSNVKPSLLPPDTVATIVKVFSQLPYDVLWKWDEDELPGRTKNIRIAKWLPQTELLKHPNIKVFITQGGLQSTEEAITAGVPLIGLPIMGDQWYNVEKYAYHKIGAHLDIKKLQEGEFKKTIEIVIGDQSYRRNILRIRELMNDELVKPLDRAIWWTEHILRHGGGSHLRAPTANISWKDYLELDLVFTALFILTVILTAFVIIVVKILKCICKIVGQDKRKIKSS